MKLLLATHNQGKLEEYRHLLADLPIQLVSLRTLGIDAVVAETGSTFKENALLKARGYAALSGLTTIADDSGLEVDALNGAPGVLTARYGGADLSDEERYLHLLVATKDVPKDQRGARFRCVLAIVSPEGREATVSGTFKGEIAREPRGTEGFGYDPVFLVPEYGVTMAQLSPETKNRISHRALAAAHAVPVLVKQFLGC